MHGYWLSFGKFQRMSILAMEKIITLWGNKAYIQEIFPLPWYFDFYHFWVKTLSHRWWSFLNILNLNFYHKLCNQVQNFWLYFKHVFLSMSSLRIKRSLAEKVEMIIQGNVNKMMNICIENILIKGKLEYLSYRFYK